MNIIVTGASKGIGFEVCRKFLVDKRNRVIAISRTSGNLSDEGIFDNDRLIQLSLDIGKPGFTSKVVTAVKSNFNSVDVIINNAGLLINKPFSDLSDNDFDEIFSVNVKSVFSLVRDLIPFMGQSSHILNITSMGGFQGSAKFPGLSLYSASKGALSVLTETIAEELKEKKIYSNALALGAVQTEMLGTAFPNFKAPLQASEMADFIVYFAKEGHKFFNGKVLPVSLSTP